MKMIRSISIIIASFTGICSVAFGAVTFTNTPAAVSNTYSGFVSLQIAGIPTGDTVVVQKFFGINTNNYITSSDTLVQQFNLTDGQPGQVIGGITNYNVPGDLNAVTGSVTATLSFQNGDIAQNLVGKYFYKLSSPAGHFLPITNIFAVTNFPFPQKFTGNVVSNSTATILSNAVIILFPPPRPGHNDLGQPVAGTVANNLGAYSMAMPPGTYRLVAFRTNFVTVIADTPLVALGSGLTVNTNLSLTNATANITVTLVDATNNAIKLPGVFMPFENSSGLLAVGYSDSNGVVGVRVTAGTWTGGTDDSGLIVHGYVSYNNGTNVNSGTSVTLPYQRANALFYGSVMDGLGNPIPDIDINDFDTTSNLYDMDGYSDPNGNYYVGALGLGANDPWQLNTSGESTASLTNYVFSQPAAYQNGTNLAPGTAVLQNFVALLATNTISGTVKDNSNNPITNVQVYAYAMINNQSFQAQANTDVNGRYSENVPDGDWTVNVLCGGGNNSLPNNYQCPNSVMVAVNGTNVVTNFVVSACGSVSITTSSPLPLGETGLYYNQNFQATSCNPSFTWTNTSGTLPPGLSLDSSSGNLSGVPTTSGAYNFTIMVTDGSANSTSQPFSLSISNGVQITTSSLPNGTNGFNYNQQLQASNGVAPYAWSLTSGSLPANLSLSGGGLISGTAATSGTYNFTAQVTDNLGASVSRPLSLTLVQTNIPSLAIAAASGKFFVFWPASAGTNFTLLMTTNLATGPWVPVTNGVPQTGISVSNTAPQLFFRLQ
jgi:hypothetical protein